MSTATESKGISLGQTEVWVDRQGREHLVEEMSVRYKANVIGFLERRAPRIVGRALADHYVAQVGRMFQPVPCVQCEGLDGDGTRKINRWQHGVDHLIVDPDKYPDEVDAMLPDLPTVTNDEAVEMVRRTPFMKRLIDDVASGLGGTDD